MTGSLAFDERDHLDKLVVRVDFSDEKAWRKALSAMSRPWDGGAAESTTFIVNDRIWDGAGIARITNAAREDDYLSVVFLADRETMNSPDHTLLAVNLDGESNYLDEVYDAEHGTSFGRQFRILPQEASGLQVNLALGNMDYVDWADHATQCGDGVFRGL